jgi:hypothetical protein
LIGAADVGLGGYVVFIRVYVALVPAKPGTVEPGVGVVIRGLELEA